MRVALMMLAVAAAAAEESRRELVQVAVVTRHGQRTPKAPYPSDPWRDRSYWPEGWMQLTETGAHQLRELGHLLRNRYFAFLPAVYSAADVLATSTATSRTLASAEALLSALYPGEAVPVSSNSAELDALFTPHRPCPAYERELRRFRSTPEYVAEEAQRRPLYAWLTAKLGKGIESLIVFESLYSCLTIEKQRGLKLPRWTRTVYPEPARTLAGKYLREGAQNALLRRLRYGNLLKDIVGNAAAAGATSRKLLLYSAHDFTLAGLLQCLGEYDGSPPGFAAALLLEVRRDAPSGKNVVDVFYRNDSAAYPARLPLRICGEPCFVDKLESLMDKYFPRNITAECSLAPVLKESSEFKFSPAEMFVMMSFLLLCLGIGALLVICFLRILSEDFGLLRAPQSQSSYTKLEGRNQPRYKQVPAGSILKSDKRPMESIYGIQ